MSSTCSKTFGTMCAHMLTEVPGPQSRSICDILKKHESPSSSYIASGAIPVVWHRARGANIEDVDGNVFIDLTGAFCVAGIGHCNDRVVEALSGQARQLLHSQGVLNPNVPRAQLVQKLASIAPGNLDKSILVNTGAEAVELAIKTARLYTGRDTIVAFHGGFHGKTYGALSVTSRNAYREPFHHVPGGVVHLPFAYCYRCPFGREYPGCRVACLRHVEQTMDDPSSGFGRPAAVLLEPIQGHDGWIEPPVEFIQGLRKLCSEREILLVLDEIITGFGRTGHWFAADYFGIVPDLMILAKGIAGGFPISAVIAPGAVVDAWAPGLHSSTFSGNPVGSAACLAAIAELEAGDWVRVACEKGARIKARFHAMAERHPIIGDVRGPGMMIGVELVRDRRSKAPATAEAGAIVKEALSRGVIVNQGGKYANVLKMSPPFVITEEQTAAAAETIEACIAAVEQGIAGYV